MKVINAALILIILSGCGQNKIQVNEKTKKVGIRNFTSKGPENHSANWYYIRSVNAPRDKGYYFESKKTVENFTNANFVYYDSRPEELNKIYPLQEKIILVNAKDLPENIQQSVAGLESISVRE